MLYFALNHQNEVLIIKSPSDLKEQKKFLGYEWSNRKGDEGLKELHNPYQSQLFDRENPHNETKINVLIKNAFLQNTKQIPQELEKHAIKVWICLIFLGLSLIKPAHKILPFIRLPFVEIVKQIYKKI
mgnify:FL=1